MGVPFCEPYESLVCFLTELHKGVGVFWAPNCRRLRPKSPEGAVLRETLEFGSGPCYLFKRYANMAGSYHV